MARAMAQLPPAGWSGCWADGAAADLAGVVAGEISERSADGAAS
jgi:hypothetical protein